MAVDPPEFLAKILGVEHFTFCLEYAVLFYTFFPITLYVLRRTGSFVDCSSSMGSLLACGSADRCLIPQMHLYLMTVFIMAMGRP